mgnify:CR=1 FL=1
MNVAPQHEGARARLQPRPPDTRSSQRDRPRGKLIMFQSFDDVSETEGTLVLHWDEVRVPVTIGVGS